MSKTNSFTAETRVSSVEAPTFAIYLMLAFGALTAVGISFALHAMYVGHDHVFGTTREVPWGILISGYAFFACLSTGLTIIASLGQVFGIEVFKPIVKRTVLLAIVTIACALMSISLELENPWRVPIYAVLSPHPESNIWWKSTIYSTYLLVLAINFLMLHRGNYKMARIFGTIALIAVSAANLNMKADMSLVASRQFWVEQYMPLYFFTYATLLGCSAVLFFNWFAYKVRGEEPDAATTRALSAVGKLMMVLLAISAVFTGWKAYLGYNPSLSQNPEALVYLVQGDYSTNFWFGEVALAVVIPFTILAVSRAKGLMALSTAGLVCLVGIFFKYYDLVIVGQLVPHFHKYNIVNLPQYFSYTPSLHENMMLLGGIALAFTLFLFGEIVFNTPSKDA